MSKEPSCSRVVLVHGIRTFGYWHETVRDALESENLRVTQIKYGYLDIVRFLIPGAPRRSVVEKVERDLLSIHVKALQSGDKN